MLKDCRTTVIEKHPGRDHLSKGKADIFSPKSSLDQVAKEIRNVLRKLDKTINTNASIPKKPIVMKIEQKEFFQTESSKKQKTLKSKVTRKSSVQSAKRKSSTIVNKLSENSIKIMNIKHVKSGTLSRHGSVNAILSTQLMSQLPSKISTLKVAKSKKLLNTNETTRNQEALTSINRAKIAKDVQNMMKAALIESEYLHKIPVIDVANFINKSLKLSSPTDFPELRKIVEKKSKLLHSDSLSESDSCTKSIQNIGETESIERNTALKSKENQNILENDSNMGKRISEKNDTCKNSQDNSNSKIIIPVQPTMHTLRSLPNHGYMNRSLPKSNTRHGQSKTTNSLMKQKSQLNTSMSPTNQHRQTATVKARNKSTNRNSTLNKTRNQSNIEKGEKIGNSKVTNIKTRSNSALRNGRSSTSSQSNVRNILLTPPSASRQTDSQTKNSPVGSKNSVGMKRDSSLVQGSARKINSNFSSNSSRLLNTKKTNSFNVKVSSNLHLHGVSSRTSKRQVEPFTQLKEEVNRAIRDRKTFTVRGNYPAVRKALLKRGWVEKLYFSDKDRLQSDIYPLKYRSINELLDMMQVKDLSEICKKLIKSKLLINHQVDLYWGPNCESFQINPDKVKYTKINKFRRDVFSYTSKQGLCDAARNAHWFNFPGLAQINHPRTYALAKHGETAGFIKDFRRTAVLSLLKWLIKNHDSKECKIVSSSGKIPLEAFHFAANECYKMILESNNQDIDHPVSEASEHEWTQFLEYYYKIIHVGNHFKSDPLETENSIIEKSTYLIKKLIPHYPHLKMDGTMNIWILKPSSGSQGRGIHICRTLQYIMQTIKNNNNTKYIVQKYIERPLLIFNTKFDIRQWFLISCASPLTIWMYKECYLRFSSQTYNLRKLHESIHLTNNSVQQRYQSTAHDVTLPSYNMWDSVQFRKYLSNIGYPDIFRRVIYKGMKECIICAVMIHQDKIDKRKNCFELYGADFMLTEDFQPWLIEINSSPALYASTPITSRMCPQVLEDTIKVIVDRAAVPNAKTGNFELIYKQPLLPCRNSENINNLKISGTPLPENYFGVVEEQLLKKMKSPPIVEKQDVVKKTSKPKLTDSEGVKETLQNLLKFIQNEKKKRRKKVILNRGTDPMGSEVETVEEKISSCTCTSSIISFGNLRSQLDELATEAISISEEDMIGEALKMLQNRKRSEVVMLLLEVIESIIKQPRSNNV